ncbi:MAG: hypothetical protein J6M46_00820 [Lachnospiraceae bacterium]|nr:hypothetical protein [Lachnospiraceae bacterium]
MKRIKRTNCLILALLVTFCLAGCESTQDPQEAEGLNEAARGILQEWLNEAEPGAEILSCKADTFQYPGQVKAYLTGYVSGSFQSGEETTGYTVCPATGRIYLDADMEVLGEAMYDYILSCMELEEIEERTDYSVDLELPYCYEGPGSRGSLKGKMFAYGRLPAELAMQMQDMPEAAEPAALEDFRQAVQDWLSDPENGDCLGVLLNGSVADEVDFDRYDLPFIQEREKADGLYFNQFSFWHKDETVSGSAWLVESDRHGWMEKDGLKLWTRLSSRSDLADSREPDGILRERHTYDPENISIEETAEGWQIRFLEEGTGPYFYLYAPEDHPMRAHDYTLKTADDEREVHWKYVEAEELWVLAAENDSAWHFDQTTQLIIR